MPNQDSTQNPQRAPLGQVPDPTLNQFPPIEPAVVPNVSQSDLSGSTPVHTDLPPLPPDFQSVAPEDSTLPPTTSDQPTEDNGSAAPSDLPPMVAAPKKKFGGGKIIATILGVLLLIGGIGTGIILTQQQQLFQQKAEGTTYCSDINIFDCVNGCTPDENGGYCTTGGDCSTYTSEPNCPRSKCNWNNGVCNAGAETVICTSYTTQTSCPTSKCFWRDSICNQGTDPGGGGGGGTTPDCGGSLAGATCTTGADCHCQGGDDCTSLKCEPDIHQSCTDQGRAWCDNYKSGAGKTCCVKGYVCYTGVGGGCTNPTNPTNPPHPTTPPTPGPDAVCQSVKAYSATWTLLTNSQLSALTSGSTINFCVAGTTSSGSFDKAKFTITSRSGEVGNGNVYPETTVKRPGSQDFCQSYTLAAGVRSVDVTAQIHHTTLGWK